MDTGLLDALDSAASIQHKTRSALLAEAAIKRVVIKNYDFLNFTEL